MAKVLTYDFCVCPYCGKDDTYPDTNPYDNGSSIPDGIESWHDDRIERHRYCPDCERRYTLVYRVTALKLR